MEDESAFSFSGRTILDSSNAIKLPSCDTSAISEEAIVWFSLLGTGDIYFLTTEGSNFDTVMNIFKGECFDLDCILWNDDASINDRFSNILLCTQPNVNYLVAIGGFNLAVGEFQLRAFNNGPCFQQSKCSDVQSIITLTDDSYGYYDYFEIVSEYDEKNTTIDYYDYYNFDDSVFITVGDLRILDNVFLSSIPRCSVNIDLNKNAWYAVRGNDIQLHVNTCDSCFDTVLSIYESMDGCDELRCIEQNDDVGYYGSVCVSNTYNDCTVNERVSAVSFCGASWVQYYILVSGFYDLGAFKLSITQGRPCLYNNQCDFAKSLLFNEIESIDLSINDYYLELYDVLPEYSCNSLAFDINSAWYHVLGNGGLIEFLSHSDVELHVFIWTSVSNSCTTMPDICLDSFVIENSGDFIEFCTKPDQTYWISIHSPNNYGMIEFELLKGHGCRDIENQNCDQRELVSISNSNRIISGNTNYAGGDYDNFYCNYIFFEPPGYSWYSIIGNGKMVQVSTCNSNFDTILGVFESSCTQKTCVTANDDHSMCNNRGSALEFCALKNIEYLILLSGYSNQSGNYEIQIREMNLCKNTSVCGGSEFLGSSLPIVITGSTLDKPPYVDIYYYQISFDCLSNSALSFINSHWYSFLSDESLMIEAQIGYATFPVIMNIFTSNCLSGRTNCYPYIQNSDNYDPILRFCGDYNDYFYFMIAGENDLRGDYEIFISYDEYTSCSIEEEPILLCTDENINVITSLPHNLYGDTIDPTTFIQPLCNNSSLFAFIPSFINEEVNSIFIVGFSWFSVTGNSYDITLNSCSNVNSNLKYFIYEENCSSNECINVYSSLDECKLKWCGVPNKQYYITIGSLNIYQTLYHDYYEILLTNGDICVGSPHKIENLISSDKNQSSITFSWVAPFSYGYPILYYTYELYNVDNNVNQLLFSGTTVNNNITFVNLQENTEYTFEIKGTNQWGDGIIKNITEQTLTGLCEVYTFDINTDDYKIIYSNYYDYYYYYDYDYSSSYYDSYYSGGYYGDDYYYNSYGGYYDSDYDTYGYDYYDNDSREIEENDSNTFSGNFIIPNNSGIIYSIEILVNKLKKNSVFYLVLYENKENQLFKLIDIKSYEMGAFNTLKNLHFGDLDWNICKNKKYFVGYYFPNAEIIQSDSINSISSCIGDIFGMEIQNVPYNDFYFYNISIPDHIFWYNPILLTNLFQMRIDYDIISVTDIPPSIPTIESIYSSVTSITMIFIEPCSISPIISYDAYLYPGERHISLQQQEEIYFSNLTPNTEYLVTLSATNQFGISENSTKTIKTLSSRFSIDWLSQSGLNQLNKSSTYIDSKIIKIDQNENVYVAGNFYDKIYFGPFEAYAQKSINDGFIVKYNSTGSPQWLIHIGRSFDGDTFINDINIDEETDGGIYVVGFFVDNIQFSPNPDTILETVSPGAENAFVAKYSITNGEFLWSKHMGDPVGYNHYCSGISIDRINKNIIVVGTYDGYTDLDFYEDNQTLSSNHETVTYYNGFIAIWSFQGHLNSTKAVHGNDQFDTIEFHKIDIDNNLNLYISSKIFCEECDYSSFIKLDDNHYLPIFENKNNIMVIKYNFNLDVQWSFLIGNNNNDKNSMNDNYSSDINVSSNYSMLFLSDYYTNNNHTEPLLYLSSLNNLNDLNSSNYQLITYQQGSVVLSFNSTNGAFIWKNEISKFNENYNIYGLTITDSGEIVLTGSYSGLFIFSDDEFYGIPFPKAKFQTCFFISIYYMDGSLLWARWAGNLYDNQIGYDVHSKNDIIVSTGIFSGSASFDCEKTVATIFQEVFTTKLISSLIQSSTSNNNNENENNEDAYNCGPLFLTEEIGYIQFPLDAYESYPNNYSCSWLINIENVPHILIYLQYFDFADSLDTLTFYDGNSTNSNILHIYSGSTAIANRNEISFYDNYYNRDEILIQSTSNSILIEFRSGNCFRGFGFLLTYESSHEGSFCDNEFDQTFTLQNGLIYERQSGGYRDNSNCFYYISPPSSNLILIQFLKFNLAFDDYIEFIDTSETQSIVIERFYGSDEIHPIQSISKTILVHFVSNEQLYDKGFILEYKVIENPEFCIPLQVYTSSNELILSQSNHFNEYLPNSKCNWDIQVNSTLYDNVYIYFKENPFSVPSPSKLLINVTESINPTHNHKKSSSSSIITTNEITNPNEVYISRSSNLKVSFDANGISSNGFIGEYCSHPKNYLCDRQIFTNLTSSFDNHFCNLFYSANNYCEWTFMPSTTINGELLSINYIMITFPLFDMKNTIEFPNDYVDILTGNHLNGPFIQEYRLSQSKSEITNPPTFITTKNVFHVIFESDDNIFGEGFNATTCTSFTNLNSTSSFQSNECNGISSLSSSKGSFNNYFCNKIHPANANCIWKVEEKNKPITQVIFIISNLNFAIEEFNGRWSDNVIIYQDNYEIYKYNYGGFHTIDNLDDKLGDSYNNQIEILSFLTPNVSLEFISNDIGFTEGFNVDYCLFSTNDERLCSAENTFYLLNRKINNHACGDYYQPNANCKYIIKPNFALLNGNSTSMDIVLYILYADLYSPDQISIFSPFSPFLIASFDKPFDEYGYDYFPKSYISSRDQFIISFTSDDKKFGKGFEAEYCSVPKPALTCGGESVLTNYTGIIHDHNCGPTYYAPMDCSWKISPPPSSLNFTYIALIFEELELGDGAEIQIFDPISSYVYSSDAYFYNEDDGNQIVKGSAIFIKNSFISIHFYVNIDSILKKGWKIQYLTVNETGICSGEQIYSNSQGYVQDHVLGHFYKDNQECSFLIEIPTARAITVRFEYFELESGYDFLEIYDGPSFSSKLIGFLTGNEIPLPFTSSSNSLYLNFQSDYSVVQRGFKLFYSDVDLVDCPLFCSGEGVCNSNGTCTCNENRFGLGCEIFPPPEPNEARLSDSLESISIIFERKTNRANMFGSKSTDCSILLSQNTINKLGFNPSCLWKDDLTFIIRVGNEATILPNHDVIEIKGGLIQDENPTNEHPYGDSLKIILKEPKNPKKPIVIVIAPNILQKNRNLVLDGSASYFNGGRKPYYIWSIDKICTSNDTCLVQNEINQQLSGFIDIQHDEILSLNANYFNPYPSDTKFYFSCVIINFLNIYSDIYLYNVTLTSIPHPMITIGGPTFREIERYEDIFIRANAEVSETEFDRIKVAGVCPNVMWQWKILVNDHDNNVFDLPSSIITNTSNIFIPKNILNYNTTYKFVLEISYSDPEYGNDTLHSEAFVLIKILPFQVDILIRGGDQIVSLSNSFQLTASLINQQRQYENEISYRWVCRKSTGYYCQTINNSFLTLNQSSNIIIDKNTYPPGDYIFSVIGKYQNQSTGIISSDKEHTRVRILRSNQTLIQIVKKRENSIQTNNYKHDGRKPLTLYGIIDDNSLPMIHNNNNNNNYSLQWSVSAGDFNLSAVGNILSLNTTGKELVIAPNKLLDGATYRFKLEISLDKNIGIDNFAEIEIQLNELPTAGRIYVSPTFGYSLTTKFTFKVTGASDDSNDMPLTYVFSIQEKNCKKTRLNNGNCPIIPISNSMNIPTFSGLIPSGEYFPIVDVFDRIGSFKRMNASFTITAFDSCPILPNLLLDYLENIHSLSVVYFCLNDFDTIRQLINIASFSMTCGNYEIPDNIYSFYFNQLVPYLNSIDSLQQSTEIYTDNQVKSFLLTSILPLFNKSSDISYLISNSLEISKNAALNGFLRDDSADSLLNALSYFISQDSFIPSSDVSNFLLSLNQIGNAQLIDYSCNTISNDISSSIISMKNQRQLLSSLSNTEISSSASFSFILPNSISSISNNPCVNLISLDFMESFDSNENVISNPISLTFTNDNNQEIPVDNLSEDIEIRIAVSTTTQYDINDLQCNSWSDELAAWVHDCTFMGIVNGFYVLKSNHLTSFALLLNGGGGGGVGGGGPPSISTFGSFDTYFTAATEIFGPENLDENGNLLSSFTALSDIPTEAFATSNEVYDILQYSYTTAENLHDYRITWVSMALIAFCILIIFIAVLLNEIPYYKKRRNKKKILKLASSFGERSDFSNTNHEEEPVL